ncbi:hypothetical protein K523DRAFT_223307, partial [Schizophyllum commune Tattone D]
LRPDTCDLLVCSPMSLADLISYSLACKDTRRAVRSFATNAFQFHHCVAEFLTRDEAEHLQDVLRSTGAIISGSVALQFFTREPIDGCDLDIYTDRFRALELFTFVMDTSYVFSPRAVQDDRLDAAFASALKEEVIRDDLIYDKESILDAFSFTCPTRDDKVIQIIVVAHSSIDAVL